MQIYVNIKAAGKRKDILSPVPYQIPDQVDTLKQLLAAIVKQEVAQYHQKVQGSTLLPYLTKEQIDQQCSVGKVSFGGVYSTREADPEKAVENAIQCWKDGLVRVFLDQHELLELNAPINITDNALLTFIRFTLLSGGM